MITRLEPEQVEKGDYTVLRPFNYLGINYGKGDRVRATGDDLKFLLKNRLIQ